MNRRLLMGILAIVATLAPSAGLTAHFEAAADAATPTAASSSTGNALIGVFPSHNWSTVDTTNGGLAGAFAPADLGAPGSGATSYLNAMNAWQGKPNTLIDFYDGIDGNMFKSWAPIIWDTYHAVPFVSMDTDTTNAAVAGGADDGSIDYFVSELKTWISGAADVYGDSQSTHRRIYIRLDWEANASWYTWGALNGATSSTTCAQLQQAESDYVAMWRHVHDRVMAGGFTSNEVAWVFSVNQLDITPAWPQLENCGAASDVTRSIYPGDAYVDWAGIDGYAFCTDDTPTPTMSPAQVFDPMVNEFKSFTTKPISIDEVGVSTASTIQTSNYVTKNLCSTAAVKGQWLADYLTYLQTAGIKMSLWFNSDIYENTEPIDWAVFALAGPQDIVGNGDSTYPDSTPGLSYNTYSEYPAGLASSYFLTPDPHNNQVLTDSQFLGQ
jgi:mannan endo-1,4-beta-mannosidase